MGKTITIDDTAYKLLSSLKVGPQDSFTKVILRNIHRPLETCGEILDAHEQLAPPNIDSERLEKVLKGRGRRSGGRK
jgi:predicted CopG family antitoxin